jgi:hypothetical protein
MNTSFNSNSNAKLLNSLIAPLNMLNSAAPNATAVNSALNSSAGTSGIPWVGIIIFIVLVGGFIALLFAFQTEVSNTWSNVKEIWNGYFNPSSVPAADPTPAPEQQEEKINPNAQSIVEKVLPGGNDVFSVSSNKFTYYDAEPLCKALGAELATYDQVKDAWAKGADWCNYGWVKGQMAVYPTSDETYTKLQGGPEEQRDSCGKPGVNGGYFDNPEMRFGVTCVGKKPPQSQHDAAAYAKGAPLSPDALEFDKKVNAFKTEATTIGILPFNSKNW